MEQLLEKVRRLGRQASLWQPGDRLIVAVSGGPDSTALLHVLHRLAETEALQLIAAHVNHGFRGSESDGEEEAVRIMCERYRVPCETVKLDLPAIIASTGANAQHAARVERYAFLHQVARKHNAGILAFAHHADDQAETVIMRLIRGTGLTGLASMAFKRSEQGLSLIRPLLHCSKAELIAYCAEHQLAYCTDSSNEKRIYFRNQVRLEVLPYLQQYNGELPMALARLAEISGAENDYMEQEATRIFEENVVFSGTSCTVEQSIFAGLHVALQRRLIKLILNYLSTGMEWISFPRIEETRLRCLAVESFVLSLPAGIRLTSEQGRLIWHRSASLQPVSFEHVMQQGDVRFIIPETADAITIVVEGSEESRGSRPNSRYEACFDADELAWPLLLRSRRPGDRMKVMGLNGTKKVQDMFVDAKIPPAIRDRTPLLWDTHGQLLWVPGVRRSVHAPVTAATKRVVRIAWAALQGEARVMELESLT